MEATKFYLGVPKFRKNTKPSGAFCAILLFGLLWLGNAASGQVSCPSTVVVNPSLVSLCPTGANAALMAASGDTATGSVTFTNNTTTFVLPRNAADTSSVTVSGIPAGAFITGVSVTFTIGGTAAAFQADDFLNLRAPNGNIINLNNGKGGGAASGGYTNVTISSAGTTAIASTTLVSGIPYIASLVTGAPTSTSYTTPAYRSNATAWSSLYSVPNGQWTFVTDNGFSATEDTLKSWTITITYAIAPAVTWSPIGGLYTNSGATTAYTSGTAANSIYTLPSSTTVYTVTATYATSCPTVNATVTANVNSTVYVPAIAGSSSVCPTATINMTDSVSGGIWSSSTSSVATIGSSTGILTGVAPGVTTIFYTYTSGTCPAQTVSKTVTVGALSAVAGITGATNLCLSSSPTTTLSDLSTAGTFSWSSSNTSVATVVSTSGVVTGVNPGTAVITYSFNDGSHCTNTATTSVVVASTPTTISVTPSLASICSSGPAQKLVASGGLIPGSMTFSSTSASFLEQVNTAVNSSINVGGLPAGATVTGVSVTLNVGGTSGSFQSDDIFNLKAPNGNIINLSNAKGGGSGTNGFSNITISSNGTTALPTTALVSGVPYIASLATGAPTTTAFTTPIYRANATTWASLYATPSGSWTLITDNNFSATEDTFKNWSITINYLYQVPITWSPATGLYTNTAGTAAYTGTATDSVYALPTSSTVYTLTATNAACTSSVTETTNVGTTLYVPAINGPSSVCLGATITLTDSTTGGVWTSNAPTTASIGSSTGIVTGLTAGATTMTYTYAVGTCAPQYTTMAITVNPLPTVNVIVGTTNLCLSASPTSTLTDATTGGTFAWTSGNIAVATVGSATGTVTGVTPGVATISYTINNGTCSNTATTNVTVASTPTTVSVTPSQASVCNAPGTPTQMLAASGGIVPGSVTFSNTSTTFAIPANAADTSSIVVSGIPAGATVTSVTVTFNVAGTSGSYQTDDIFNLRAPNGNIINLDNAAGGGSGSNGFTNVAISSAGTTALGTATLASGVSYIASLNNATPSSTFAANYRSNSTTWASLYSAPNGTWTFITDNTYSSTENTLNSWSITINYTYQVPITWSPNTGLYTNSAGTTAYTGGVTDTVYALPTTTTIYTVTATNGACPKTANVTVNVGSTLYVPVITGASTVCSGSTIAQADSTTGGTWTSSNTAIATVNPSTGVVTGASVTSASTVTINDTLYSGTCKGFASKTITVNPIPVVAPITGTNSFCTSGSTTSTLADTSVTGTHTWSSSALSVATIGSATGVVVAVAPGNSVVTYSLNNGTCSNTTTTNVSVANPAGPVSLSPNVASVCNSGPAVMLTASGGIVPGAAKVLSGTINLPVSAPNAVAASTLAVSSVPAGAVVTGVAVNVDFTSTYQYDYVLNLVAPDGKIVNLANLEGAHPGNYTSTVFSSAGTAALSSGTTPFTGTYAADLIGAVGPVPYVSNTSLWSDLYTTPNGSWTLVAYNTTTFTNAPTTLTDWSITVNYTYLAPITWSPATGLFTNSGATTAYTGAATDTVYASPATTTLYSVTATSGACNTSSTVNVYSGPSIYVPAIGGPSSVCAASSITLTDSISGGIWASTNTAIATVNSSTGVVTGVGAGTVNISYNVSSGTCAGGFRIKTITVNGQPVVGTISGPSTVCSGTTVTLSDGVSGGTWTSGNTSVVTIGSSSGIVTPVGVGNATITYSVSNGTCSNATGTSINSLATPAAVSVNPSATAVCAAGPAAQLQAVGGLVSGSVSGSNTTSMLFNYATTAASPISVSGIPAGATITNVSVYANVSVTAGNFTSNGIINLQGANGHVINLANAEGGGSSAGYNTTISSTSVSPLSGGAAPFTGTYAADLVGGVGLPYSDSTTWSALYSSGAINGTWNLLGNDNYNGGHFTINSWSLTINYTVPASYTWSPSAGLYSNSGATTAYTGVPATSVYALPTANSIYTIIASNGTCTSTSTASVTVNPLPVISAGSNSAICYGNSKTLTATGGSTYTWAPASNLSATTGATVVASPTVNATYVVTGTNSATGCSNTASVTITVNPLPSAITGTLSTCASGGTAALSDASGSGTWTSSNGNATINSTSGNVTGVIAGNSTITFRLPTGCSTTAVFTVNPLPTIITSGNTAICYGFNTTLGASGGISYTWAPSTGLSATTGAVVVASPLTNTTYVVTGTNSFGCNNSSPLTVSVNPLPAPIVGTDTNNFCLATIVTLSDDSTGGVWTSNNTSIATIDPATGIVSGVTTGIDTIIYTLPTTCTAMFIGTVNPIPDVNPIASAPGICNNTETTADTFSSTSYGSSTVYSWKNSTPAIGLPASGMGNIAPFFATDSTDSFAMVAVINVTPMINGCPGSVQSFSITVNPTPVPTPFSNLAYCNGATTAAYNFTSSVATSVFNWTNSNPTIGILGIGSGNIASFTGMDTSIAVPVIANITVTPTDSVTGCIGNNTTFQITIKPTPFLSTSITDSICDNTLFSYNPATLAGDSTFNWSRAAVTGVSNATNSGTNNPNEVLVNTTALPVSVTYLYALNANGCVDTQNVVVTVMPKPVLTSATSPAAKCDSTDFRYTFVSSTPRVIHYWSRPFVLGIGNIAADGIDSVSEYLVNNGTYPMPVVYKDSLTYGGCYNIQNVTVTINPKPVLTSAVSLSRLCDSTRLVYVSHSATTGTTYGWSRPAIVGNLAATGTSDTISEYLVNNTSNPALITYADTLKANGCSNVQYVSLNVIPKLLLSSTVTPAGICDSATFSYPAASATTAATFAWSRAFVTGINEPAATGTGNVAEKLINTTNDNLTVVYIYTISDSGCSNTENVKVIVHPTPVLSSNLAPFVCSGSPLSYHLTSYTSGTTFTWKRLQVSNIAPATSAGTGATISETLTDSLLIPVKTVYDVTLTANGCPHDQFLTVTVNPAPPAGIITTFPPSSLCSNTMYQNFGTSIAAPAGQNYVWSAQNATIYAEGKGHQYILVNFENQGDAVITVNSNILGFGCTTNNSYTVNVGSNVSENPQVIYFNGQLICLQNNFDSYQWGYDDAISLDSTLLPGEINPNYFVSSLDLTYKYYWVITTHNGCLQKTYYNVPPASGLVSVAQVAETTGLKVFPNPANDVLNVELNTSATGAFELSVINMLGQKVNEAPVTNHKAAVSVGNLAAGTYLLVCYHEGVKVATVSFVKN